MSSALTRAMIAPAVLAMLSVAPIDPGWAQSSTGALEIRVTDHKPGIDQFRFLDVTLAAVALHEKGKGRREGWVEIAGPSPAIDIVPLKDGVYETLDLAKVATGAYDAVAVRFGAVESELKAGGEPTVRLDDAVVSFDLRVSEQGNAPLVIDLYAEDQTEHDPPRYVVKVKEVRPGA